MDKVYFDVSLYSFKALISINSLLYMYENVIFSQQYHHNSELTENKLDYQINVCLANTSKTCPLDNLFQTKYQVVNFHIEICETSSILTENIKDLYHCKINNLNLYFKSVPPLKMFSFMQMLHSAWFSTTLCMEAQWGP